MSSAARHLTPVSTTLPFATLDDHRVILRLGQGGMAEVFLAARPDPGSRELVVIKRLHGSDDDDPALERMLRDEALLAMHERFEVAVGDVLSGDYSRKVDA